ncbi:MAG: GNAT family N-acetyltransferase [Massilia sp.]
MIPTEELPAHLAKRLPRAVPGFSLARLAVATTAQGHVHGHGEYLMVHAMTRTRRVANEIGGYALFFDAKDDQAARFYQKYGFAALPDNAHVLCMPFSAMPELP